MKIFNANLNGHISPPLMTSNGNPFGVNFFSLYFKRMPGMVVYGKVLYSNDKPYDFIFIDTNPAFQQQIGLVPINGQRASEVIPGICEADPEMFTRQGRVAAGGPSEQFEIYISALNEWFSAHMFSPKPGHFLVIFDKITQRVLKEQHLERVLGEQKAVLDSHIVGIAKIRDRKFIWANSTFENLLGYKDNELIGQSTRVCYRSDEDYVESGKIAFSVLNRDQVFRAELQLVTKDGSLRWYAFHAEMLLPDKVESLMMLVDITQQKEMDIELLATKKELEDLYDNAPCGYHSLDEDGTFQKINATELAWLGCTREEVVGKMKPTDFFTPESKALFARKFQQFKITGNIENIPMELISKYGIKKHVSVSASIIKDANGNFLGTRSLMYDVTKIKQMEDQIQQLAFYDTLTHLPNRNLFEDRLNRTLNASERNYCYAALMFIDLDNFKPLNDAHGHAVGDLLLVDVAQRLKACVREIDTVARFGGDEFVIIISELSKDKAESIQGVMKVAKKIHRVLEKPYKLTQDQPGKLNFCVEHRCSGSIGIKLFIGHAHRQTELLKQADSAMYQAKKSGKNSICLYAENIDNKQFK